MGRCLLSSCSAGMGLQTLCPGAAATEPPQGH